MKKVIVSLITLLFVFNSLQSQEHLPAKDFIVNKIEDYILNEQIDSVPQLLSQQKLTPYLESLNRIYKKDNPTYLDYFEFVSSLGKRHEVNYSKVSSYINESINAPNNKESIDLDYVNIKWLQVSKLRDEASIGEASIEQGILENYIARFNENDIKTTKAQLLASTHQLVLYQIQEDIEKGKKLCLENLEKARELSDNKLEIIFLYHLCDFYILERKLEKYIETSEQSLMIDEMLPNRTSYYIGNVMHLVDAYIFKGGNEDRVDELLEILYSNPETKADSYSFYVKYLGVLELDSSKTQLIFKRFEVSNLLEFCEKIINLGEELLNPNDFFHVLNESSNTLAKHGFYNEALENKDKSVLLTRKIYSQDLSQSLSSFRTKQTLKEKEIEVEREKERSRLYIIITFLVVGLLVIVSVFLIRKQKQSKILRVKNNQINQALKEKKLLVKEVHHRVKNNFQVVSSLLELQTHGIKDKKALAFVVENQNRVKSMALIHQKLYQNKNDLVDFKDYVKHLINELSQIYAINKNVEIHTDIENVSIDIDTAIPLGLIVNELITNAYKHAFIEKELGELSISIRKYNEESYELVVSDDGKGIADFKTIEAIKKFGLHLVNRLVKQLHGKLTLENNNGLKVLIIFKDFNSRKNID